MNEDFWKAMSQACVLALIAIAAIVASMLIFSLSAWRVIILYWIVLTVKNACDWMAVKK